MGANPLSAAPGPYQVVARHLFDDKIFRGLCLNCGKIFVPGDPQYVDFVLLGRAGLPPSACGFEQPLTDAEREEDHSNDTFEDLDGMKLLDSMHASPAELNLLKGFLQEPEIRDYLKRVGFPKAFSCF